MRSKITAPVLFLLALLTFLTLPACQEDTSDRGEWSFVTETGTGYLRKADTLWILNLHGNYRDMGRQYGALFKDQLRTLFTEMNGSDNTFQNPRTLLVLGALKNVMDTREAKLLEGMASEAGLTSEQLEFLNASLFFMYAPKTSGLGCSAFSATRSQTTSGFTIAGRNFDNPTEFSGILRNKTVLVIFNPREQFTGNHRDNSVAIVSQIGWLYGLTNLNSKGIYLEYNNATNSIKIDPNPEALGRLIGTIMDGLHQNFYAAFDSDSLSDVEQKLAGKAAIANMTQIADKDHVWHYERSPYENSRLIPAGARGFFSYDNPANTDIITNHFFNTDWLNQVNNDPSTFNPEHDSGSKTFARLVNLQKLARQHEGQITPELMKEIMTTHLRSDGTGGPFIGWELLNQDVTHFTSVTDINSKVMHIYPYVDSVPDDYNHSVQWTTIDLNMEFR